MIWVMCDIFICQYMFVRKCKICLHELWKSYPLSIFLACFAASPNKLYLDQQCIFYKSRNRHLNSSEKFLFEVFEQICCKTLICDWPKVNAAQKSQSDFNVFILSKFPPLLFKQILSTLLQLLSLNNNHFFKANWQRRKSLLNCCVCIMLCTL